MSLQYLAPCLLSKPNRTKKTRLDDWLAYSCILSERSVKKGTFNNFVDNKRWVGGPKMPIFVHVQG